MPQVTPPKSETAAVKDPNLDSKTFGHTVSDQEHTAKILTLVRKWLDAESKNSAYMVKDHPRGQHAMEVFSNKVFEMFQGFVENQSLPHIDEWTPEQLQASLSGFWESRSEKIMIERKRG